MAPRLKRFLKGARKFIKHSPFEPIYQAGKTVYKGFKAIAKSGIFNHYGQTGLYHSKFLSKKKHSAKRKSSSQDDSRNVKRKLNHSSQNKSPVMFSSRKKSGSRKRSKMEISSLRMLRQLPFLKGTPARPSLSLKYQEFGILDCAAGKQYAFTIGCAQTNLMLELLKQINKFKQVTAGTVGGVANTLAIPFNTEDNAITTGAYTNSSLMENLGLKIPFKGSYKLHLVCSSNSNIFVKVQIYTIKAEANAAVDLGILSTLYLNADDSQIIPNDAITQDGVVKGYSTSEAIGFDPSISANWNAVFKLRSQQDFRMNPGQEKTILFDSVRDYLDIDNIISAETLGYEFNATSLVVNVTIHGSLGTFNDGTVKAQYGPAQCLFHVEQLNVSRYQPVVQKKKDIHAHSYYFEERVSGTDLQSKVMNVEADQPVAYAEMT